MLCTMPMFQIVVETVLMVTGGWMPALMFATTSYCSTVAVPILQENELM